MAIERLKMVEETQGVEPEDASLAPQTVEAGREPQILGNAALGDKERIEAAQKLLGVQLEPTQEKAILEAHHVGAGQSGKDKSPSGVYNYNIHQLGEKLSILEKAGFSKEQRFQLLKLGIAGRLPPSEFGAFDPNTINNAKLKKIAENIKTIGGEGNADENYLFRNASRIEGLIDSDAITDSAGITEAQGLLTNLEAWRITAVEGVASADPLLTREDIKRFQSEIAREGDSEFARAKVLFEHYSGIDVSTLPAALRAELVSRRNATRADILALIQQTEQLTLTGGSLGVLDDVRKRALEFYKEVKATKRHEKYGRNKQHVVDQARSLNGYGEFFWDNSPELKQLESRFRGVARYVWDGIAAEVDKEVNFEASPALNPVAVGEFQRVKELRSEDRKREKKYTTHEYYGSRNYELTAENAGELVPSVLDWFRDQLAEVSDTDVGSTNEQLTEIRRTGVRILETCRVRLETEERQEISETHPEFLRAKALIEGGTDVLGYEKVIYKGGEDISAQYAERFASNYIGHHDAIYLNPKVAYILLKLRTHRKGTYWMGHPFSEEKVDEGYMRDYRQMIQEEIVEEAAARDVFINEDDFYKRDHVDVQVNPEGKDLRYSFHDNIEELLLDPGDRKRQAIVASGDAAVLRRHDIRVKVFRDIKTRRDGAEGLAGLTEVQRQDAIRRRIVQKMGMRTGGGYISEITQKATAEMQAARQAGDLDAYDKAMWGWVEEYNNLLIRYQMRRWYPSGWDRVRMKIDKPEKLLDRKLTDEQIDAMYDPIKDAPGISSEERERRKIYAIDTSRFGFQLARGYAIFEMEDVLYGGIRTRIRDPRTGEPVDPGNKVVRVFDVIQQRLERAIAEEEAELEQEKATAYAEIAALRSQGRHEDAKTRQIKLDKKILKAQFLATHALKAAGFVDGKLPVCSGQLKDDSTINFFANTLAAYGVNVAYGEPITHNSKDLLYEILERGRRAYDSEDAIAAQEEMVGTYPVFARDAQGNPMPQFDAQGRPVLVKAYMLNPSGEETYISERNRIVNAGAVREHRSIADTRYETSTSGGVAVPEGIPKLGYMGFRPNLIKSAVVSIAGLHGLIKRGDETEVHAQKLFTTMDPVYSARERGQAYKAKKLLIGGSVGEGKTTPGFLNEPFHGAFKSADWLHEHIRQAQSLGVEKTLIYLALMREFRWSGKSYSQFLQEWEGEVAYINKQGDTKTLKVRGSDLERYRQYSYLDLDKLTKEEIDRFYVAEYEILDYFQDYLKATKPLLNSRGGRALRSWEEENHKKWYAFRRMMREAIEKGEKGFIMRLGYSPEVASDVSMRMMEVVLMDADYLILRGYEVQRRVDDGEEILSEVLTDQEKQAGFVIPPEENWSTLRQPVQKALQTIRRRGLLEFMTEEGYKIYKRDAQGNILINPKTKNKEYYREILGKKIPPFVQGIKVEDDKLKVRSA